MALIEWQERFSIGIPAVDHEHREMIGLLNELYERLLQEQGDCPVVDFLGEVFAQISAHFALEEREMRDMGYDAYEAHKAEHEELLEEIRIIMDDYEEGMAEESVEDLGMQLEAWFSNHFRTQDSRLHKFLEKNGGR
jgi:hemerythrin-like metal-binding protein